MVQVRVVADDWANIYDPNFYTNPQPTRCYNYHPKRDIQESFILVSWNPFPHKFRMVAQNLPPLSKVQLHSKDKVAAQADFLFQEWVDDDNIAREASFHVLWSTGDEDLHRSSYRKRYFSAEHFKMCEAAMWDKFGVWPICLLYSWEGREGYMWVHPEWDVQESFSKEGRRQYAFFQKKLKWAVRQSVRCVGWYKRECMFNIKNKEVIEK